MYTINSRPFVYVKSRFFIFYTLFFFAMTTRNVKCEVKYLYMGLLSSIPRRDDRARNFRTVIQEEAVGTSREGVKAVLRE